MGEVYRATDSTLGRDVAIKVLPLEVAQDPERLARFEREAKLLASLNHPNIAHVYGFESATLDDGSTTHFLAMELVPGEDLAERLKRGAIPLDEAIAIARQIAEALEEAHEHGIVHRDLKPANVKITPGGKVKVLDFGLAKAYAGDAASGSSADLSQSPTLAHTGTQAGLILGTAAYMSPEQARGKPVDKRADVWALGVVLYEMLTGRRLFAGETVSDTLAAVLTHEPDWAALPEAVRPELRLSMRRCLARDPLRRWRSAGDLAQVLDDVASAPAGVARTRGGAVDARWRWVALLALVASAVATFLAVRGAGAGRGAAGLPALSYQSLTSTAGMEVEPTLSPDGKQVAYASNADGDWDVYLVRVAGGKPINLTADSGSDDYQPAFSPDGERIAFRSERDGGGVYVMGATGESVRRASSFGFNPSWSPDGRRLVVASEGIRESRGRETLSRLALVDVVTGAVTEIGGDDAVQPSWSPGGRRIAFWGAWPVGSGHFDVWTMAADGSDKRRVTDDAATDWSPSWSPDGRFLWFTSDRGHVVNAWRVPIEEASGAPLGPPQPIGLASGSADQVRLSTAGLVYTALDLRSNLMRVDFDPVRETVTGSPVALTRGTQLFNGVAPAPDGSRVALSTSREQGKLILVSRDGAQAEALVTGGDMDQVVWRPDGSELAFSSRRSGSYQVWSIRPDGSALRQLTDAAKGVALPVWAPDGRRLVGGWDEPSYFDATSGPPMQLLSPLPRPPQGVAFWPQTWSPDGRQLAGYVNGEKATYLPGITVLTVASGTYRVVAPGLVHSAPTVPTAAWLRDGRRLLYSSKDILLVDTKDGRTRSLLASPPGVSFGRAAPGPGDREIFFLREEREADVWIATFATEPR
jgi:eukaryotic-like serine/threonine-protein kinase